MSRTEEGSPGGTMLDLGRRGEFETATNRRNDLAWADWRFLLPDPEPGRVLFAGVPRFARLVAFAERADEVIVACPDRAALRELRRRLSRRAVPRVRLVCTGWEAMPCRSGSVSVVVMVSRRAVRALGRSPGVAAETDRVLGPRGAVCLVTGTKTSRGVPSPATARLTGRGFAGPRSYWLVPPTGPSRALLPRGDREAARHLFERVLQGRSLRKRAFIRLGGWLARRGLLRLVLHRTVSVLWRPGAAGPGRNDTPGGNSLSVPTDGPAVDAAPPAYLAPLLRENGLEPDRVRASFSLNGAYNTSKVLCFLFRRGEGSPGAVIMLPRSPRYNHRLENEGRALSHLAERRLLPAGAHPEPIFLGHARGLAVLGQRFVHGTPFRRGTEGHPGCPRAREAVDLLVHLGEASSEPGAAFDPERSDGFRALLDEYRETYRPGRDEVDFLSRRIDALAGMEDGVPLVFQHGDPGVWNVLLRRDGGVTFLDWEAAEPRGIPLWDLFYFLRSFGTWNDWLRGERTLRATYDRCFLEDGPFARMQARAVSRYCRRVGIVSDAVEPLFYLCWIHRALKEAARLSDDDLERGTYRQLLQRCIQRRNAPGLRLLFAAGADERSDRQADGPRSRRPPAGATGP